MSNLPDCDELDFISPRIRFHEVITAEYAEINGRRAVSGGEQAASENARPPKLIGLALSGGGVRSATFNLGLLQALAHEGKLRVFDYLSTCSGGGYTGGWWSAWLSRAERDKEPDPIFPPREDIDSERDARRARMETRAAAGLEMEQIKDSAINAAADPIHHLRLFSNVLTPRKGLLSADTWRAIAVAGRNIVLTWLILIPILLAAIMVGQSWFTLTLPREATHVQRLVAALIVPGMLFLGSAVCVALWMLFTRRSRTLGDKLVVAASTLAFLALSYYLLKAIGVGVLAYVIVLAALWTGYILLRLLFWKLARHAKLSDTDFWRNRLVVLQTRTLSYAVFLLVIFLFAGFGHLIFDFLVNAVSKSVADKVAKAGGWTAFALAILSSAYTALKSAPTGGGDAKSNEPPSMAHRIAFAIAPPLLLLVLGVVLSWAGLQLYEGVVADLDATLFVSRGAMVAGFLFLIFALYEFRPPQKWKSAAVVAVWLVIAAAAWGLDTQRIIANLQLIAVVALILMAEALLVRAAMGRPMWVVGYAVALVVAAIVLTFSGTLGYALPESHIPQMFVIGVASTLVLLLFELIQGEGANTRAIALTIIACTIFVLVGGTASIEGERGKTALVLVSLIASLLGWVLALGWLADPNALSLHSFYKARLVRAYLGASNAARTKAKDADITDAVPGDDLLLTELRNTERGAPYHLINTMLNLVGGSDLSTQARASDSFLMSKHFCGSMRTGYRPTAEYACGSISLGTAVAISGAAASPTMGAQTPSAALSALMTLFNVRTGYWAPTPSMSYWRSGSARLWPVYTLQEFVSQTTDLLPYCYLTDGGHYENTGVYSLVQRGCNVIVVGECGADPEATLDDLGNMIRKVRIDFGTEIHLDITGLREDPRVHVVVGTIRYGPDHAQALGLPEDEMEGTIIVVKPNVLKGDPVDVRQYGFLNRTFPQQQTFDLWYDEAQFESYRRLGEESGKLAVATRRF